LDLERYKSTNRFPFRLGTTSYIFPSDLVANAKALFSLVDDIELVLFELDGNSNLPDPATIQALQSLAASSGLSYTVHFPSGIQLGAGDPRLRRESMDKCLKVFHLTLPLEPAAYILHFEGDQRGRVPSHDMRRWLKTTEHSVVELLQAGLPPDLTCVETLDYPFEMVEPIVLNHKLSICLDIGHVFLYGYSLKKYLDRYAKRCRVFHLHGIQEGEDHRHIRSIPESDLLHFLSSFRGYMENQKIVTVEVFNEDDLVRSLEILYSVNRKED
jgi:sugar phosphate isomerase/epimerase